jgi:hypothetical protein
MDRDNPYPPREGPDAGARQPGDALDPWRDWPGARAGQPAPLGQPGEPAYPGGYPPAYPLQPLHPGQPAYPSQPLYPGQSPYPPHYPGWGGAGDQAPPPVPPYPPPYPGQYMPGYPPQWGTPPRERGPLGWWQWLLIAMGTIVVLCCGVALLNAALRGISYRSAGNAVAPSGAAQTGAGDNMVLGADYARTGEDFTIVNQTGQFAAGDPIALVVNMNGQPFGTTTLRLQLARVEPSGAEQVVDSATKTISDPNYTELAIKWFNAGRLMGSNPPGVYKLELTDGQSVLAQASFNYTG